MPKPNIGQGDKGEAFLFGSGKRFPKDNAQFEALGTLDELNSALGYAYTLTRQPRLQKVLARIQEHLFEAQSHVGTEEGYEKDIRIPRFSHQKVRYLEGLIVRFEKDLPVLANFILPSGTQQAAQFHVCRTLARRAERCLVSVSREKNLNPSVQAYVNRLSDVLFILARFVNHEEHVAEQLWKPKSKK